MQDQVYCSLCTEKVDPMQKGAKLMGKASMKFRCNKCNTVAAAQQRWLGTWPIEEFKDLPDEAIAAFYKSAHGANPYKLKSLTMDSLKSVFIERQQETEFTEYLPINVWMSRGFTEEQVKACPSKPQKVRGTVYAVEVEQKSKSKITDQVRERIRDIQKNSKKALRQKASNPIKRLLADGSSTEVGAEAARVAEREAEDSSSSSDSEAARKQKKEEAKNKKKAKEAEKQGQQEEKDRKAAEAKRQKQEQSAKDKAAKEAAKAVKATQAFATKVTAKLSPLIPQMERIQQHDSFSQSPVWAQERFVKNNVSMIGLKAEADLAMKDKSPPPLSATLDDVGKLTQEAAAIIKIFNPILAALEKL